MSLPPKRLLLSAVICNFLLSFQAGYHLTILNVPEMLIRSYINDTFTEQHNMQLSESHLNVIWGLVVSIFSIGAMIGAITNSKLADKFGRKFSLMVINNILVILASAVMACTKFGYALELLLAGRLLMGYCSGFSTSLTAVYVSECCPKDFRGSLGSLQNFFLTFASISALIVSWPQLMGNDHLWFYMLGLSAIPAVIQLLLYPFFPESPRYLFFMKDDRAEAVRALKFFNGSKVNIVETLKDFSQEKDLTQNQTGLLALIRDSTLRYILILCSLIQMTFHRRYNNGKLFNANL